MSAAEFVDFKRTGRVGSTRTGGWIPNRDSKKLKKITDAPVLPSYLKQAWDYLQQGLVCAVSNYGIARCVTVGVTVARVGHS